jgi:hypothetical protein
MLVDQNTEEGRRANLSLEDRQQEDTELAQRSDEQSRLAGRQDSHLRDATALATVGELSLMNTNRFNHILDMYGVEKPESQPFEEDLALVDTLASQIDGIDPALAKNMRDSVLNEFQEVLL